ncbi:AraC family transcriptional regulator [Qiania dongpingensis]|uniref:Effector binding domain-containing protein n=1 Tax=Qiania dongpingensis TaxID=2763669 RepID=A0A7G9G792_9FIRM|nr:effector binding domain-containing protein [Qiania dongpingensis]QNM06674.1 effector binding domain-containing protein [Qiania dongpingensis]
MEWNEKLQMIVDYVEHYLQRKEESVDKEEIARIAGCSFDFFQKVFSYMNGISFAEYVRFRKLTLAGYDLKSTNMKIIDLSYKYGYDSPTSFTKAFQQFHGITPKEARAISAELRVHPKLRISVKQKYSWRIEQKPELRLVGKRIRLSGDDEENGRRILKFWSECQREGTFSDLIAIDTGTPKGIFGLFGGAGREKGAAVYSIMVNTVHAVPEGFAETVLPQNTWAVFDCRGAVPQAVRNGWKYLEEEWISQYPFKHADCPELEWYSDGVSYCEDYISQIWIPIVEED